MKKMITVLLVIVCLVSFALPASAAQSDTGKKVNDIPYDMLHNIYIDALEYTGYDISLQKKDKTIFKVFGSDVDKEIRSNITYGWSSTEDGMDTTEKDRQIVPDIEEFEKTTLCCASYVSYVVFNYLPNIAGVDVSDYAEPRSKINVTSWLAALEKWEKAELASFIKPYTADFKWEKIPIGSILIFGNGEHIALYAGEYDGFHFVTHVGNERGPEFQVVEYLNASECGVLSHIYVPKYALDKSSLKIFAKTETVGPLGIISKTKMLNGGLFCITNVKTNKDYYVVAEKEGTEITLPVGKYTIMCLNAPKNYEVSSCKLPMFTLIDNEPTTTQSSTIVMRYNEHHTVSFFFNKVEKKTKEEEIQEILDSQTGRDRLFSYIFGFPFTTETNK